MKTIEFFSEVPGVAEAYPIIPAKDYVANWMTAARQDYIDSLKQNPVRGNHIYQCPGIFDLHNYGYIVPMWHDVLIKTEGNKDMFAYMYPTQEIENILPGKDLVGRHVNGIDKLLPKRPWSLNPLIKFNTPWHVVAPKGVKFLMIPIAYPDSFEFDSCIGILDPGYSSEINFQVYWNVPNKEYVLKAGTPMCHLIPLSDEKFKLVVREMTAMDNSWLNKFRFLKGSTFTFRRNIIKDLYHKHFGK